MAATNNLGDFLGALFTKIKTIKGTSWTGSVNVQSFPDYIHVPQSNKTVNSSTSAQTVKPDAGYDCLSQVTVNAIGSAAHASPTLSWSGATVTASHTQTIGSVATGTATTTGTNTITTQAAKTVTPNTSEQTIFSAGSRIYCSGAVKVAAVSTDTYSLLASEYFAVGSHIQSSDNTPTTFGGYNSAIYGAAIAVSAAQSSDNTARPGIAVPVYQPGTYAVNVIMRGTTNSTLIVGLNKTNLWTASAKAKDVQTTVTVTVTSASASAPAYIVARNDAGATSSYSYMFPIRIRKK